MSRWGRWIGGPATGDWPRPGHCLALRDGVRSAIGFVFFLPEIGVALIFLGVIVLLAYVRWTEWLQRQAVEPTRETASEAKPAAGPNMSAALRERLRQECKSSGDFDAFCLDHFPQVHALFGSGMDRTQQENLLLRHVSTKEIERSLVERSGGKLDA